MSSNRLTIPIINELFTSLKLTPSQLIAFCHQLASQTNPSFNIFSQLTPLDLAFQASLESTQRYAKGIPKSALDGVPVSIKSNIAVKGFPLTANSNILQNTAGYDSILVQKLKKAGAIIIGQTNMDEFGMGSLGHHSNNGYTVNPLQFLQDISLEEYIQRIQNGNVPNVEIGMGDTVVSPGGSSSGSAASVSMGSSIISIGTDTGGSVRLPSAWCGVVGFKPTYGSISRDGVISYASSLDTVGIIAPTVECAGFALDIIKNGKEDHGNSDCDENDPIDWQSDVRDSTACFLEPVAYSNSSSSDLTGMKIGIPAAFSIEGCPKQVHQAWDKAIERLQERGATIICVSDTVLSPETVKMCLPAYYVLSCAEASSNLSRYDGLRYGMSNKNGSVPTGLNQREGQFAATRSLGFGREVQRRILAGTAVLSSDRFHSHYEGATNVRGQISKELNAAFNEVDLMVIPTAVTNPPALGPFMQPDSTEAFKNDVMTVPISLAGLPSISIPVLTKDQHPGVGMQIFGPRLSENKVLHAARLLNGL
eukprot:scaffold6860_cov297-Chaetoceros_neogracile.AAC.33